MTSTALDVSGHCDERFAPVRAAFEENFARRNEHGASFAAMLDGELVVDLWGGWADEARTRPWERDTIVLVHSTTKGMVALCLHMLAERGLLDFEAPVTRYWHEFGQAGKDAISVRTLVSHQAGIPVLDAPLEPGAGLEWPTMVRAIEQQAPIWEPGTRHGYHAGTWGYCAGELIRRITGRSPGTFFREEVAERWGIDFHIGFGPELDHRVADMLDPVPGDESANAGARGAEPGSLRARAFGLVPPKPGTGPNSRETRAAEQPSGNGHGNARAIARVYGGLARGGELEGVRLISEAALPHMWETVAEGRDEVLGTPRRFGLGFWLHVPEQNAPRGPRSFGHIGVGGSSGFADPDRRLGFGYAMNRPGAFVRSAALEHALYGCLE